jgi:polyphosphate:AMP phosphotransferase
LQWLGWTWFGGNEGWFFGVSAKTSERHALAVKPRQLVANHGNRLVDAENAGHHGYKVFAAPPDSISTKSVVMFEAAELGQQVSKADYKIQSGEVRAALLDAQRRLAEANLSVVVIVAGTGTSGKSETVNLLHNWLDVHGLESHPMGKPSDEERDRPPMWRYWRRLPERGKLAIFFGAWQTTSILDRAQRKMSAAQLDQRLDETVEFEQMLQQENTLLVKLWLHLSKAAQRKRLKKLVSDPHDSWRVTKEDWRMYKHYDKLRRIGERLVLRTGTAAAPWHIIAAQDERYRNLTVGKSLLEALNSRLDCLAAQPARPKSSLAFLEPEPVNVINRLDLSQTVERDRYRDELAKSQEQINRLTRRLHDERRSLILVFEGNDAAGKGGAIRRFTAAVDARDYRVVTVSKPTDEELSHPYLWRFWRNLPRRGKVTIYDRSWYGRVLVERVEGFCMPQEWQRAYGEINDFERQLADFGIILLKFWLAISPEEQFRRFEARQATAYKQYKITPEDWRNRDRWQSYEAAACDMIEKTSSDFAPWTLIEANDKKFARLKVLGTIAERLEREM